MIGRGLVEDLRAIRRAVGWVAEWTAPFGRQARDAGGDGAEPAAAMPMVEIDAAPTGGEEQPAADDEVEAGANEEQAGVADEEQAGAEASDDLAAMRETVLRAHPDVVPELVSGATFGELLASVEAARGAYARVSERIRGEGDPAAGAPMPPPAAAPTRPVVRLADPDGLSAQDLIRLGLAERRKAMRAEGNGGGRQRATIREGRYLR